MKLQNKTLIVAGFLTWLTSGCVTQRITLDSGAFSWGKCATDEIGASNPLILAEKLDVQQNIPHGWTCRLISEKGKMGAPSGLEEPLFRLDFVNTNLSFWVESVPAQPQFIHPNFRLHFHNITERERILKTIKECEFCSKSPPVLFAETKKFLIVTSPIYYNHYRIRVGDIIACEEATQRDDAGKVLTPLLHALHTYFDARK